MSSLKGGGRLWHNSVPNYLSPCECQVITFGGSAVDLYRYGSEHKLSQTVMMEFGLLYYTYQMFITFPVVF